MEQLGKVAYTDEQRKLVYLQLVLYPLLVFLSLIVRDFAKAKEIRGVKNN
jgi:hypothetical protein